MVSRDVFQAFKHTYERWRQVTATLPTRRGVSPASAFESDLDHLIDYLLPVAAAAASGSSQYDYRKVATEYLADIQQVTLELGHAALSRDMRDVYATYLEEFSGLLHQLESLPVSEDGPLGFRRSALTAFRFLIDEYGFEPTVSLPNEVLFRRDDRFVDLTYSPHDPSGILVVGLSSPDGGIRRGYALDHLSYSLGRHIVFDYDQFDFTQSSGMAMFMETAASVVRQFDRLLKGSSEAWSQLEQKSDERDLAYSRLMEQLHGNS